MNLSNVYETLLTSLICFHLLPSSFATSPTRDPSPSSFFTSFRYWFYRINFGYKFKSYLGRIDKESGLRSFRSIWVLFAFLAFSAFLIAIQGVAKSYILKQSTIKSQLKIYGKKLLKYISTPQPSVGT